MLGRSVRYAVQRRRSEATERELYRSQVRAEETARLERALLPTPVGRRPAARGRRRLPRRTRRAARRATSTTSSSVPTARSSRSSATSAGTARTRRRSARRCAPRGARSCSPGTATDDVLPLLERVLESERWAEEIFTTVSQLAVAPDRCSADLYLAGHPVPLLLGPPSRLLPPTRRGRALGVPVPGGWLPQRLDLGAAWRLLMYTDGIIEATDRCDGRPTGRQGGPRSRWSTHALAAGLADLVEDVIAGVRRRHGGQLADDAAAVVLGWDGAADGVTGVTGGPRRPRRPATPRHAAREPAPGADRRRRRARPARAVRAGVRRAGRADPGRGHRPLLPRGRRGQRRLPARSSTPRPACAGYALTGDPAALEPFTRVVDRRRRRGHRGPRGRPRPATSSSSRRASAAVARGAHVVRGVRPADRGGGPDGRGRGRTPEDDRARAACSSTRPAPPSRTTSTRSGRTGAGRARPARDLDPAARRVHRAPSSLGALAVGIGLWVVLGRSITRPLAALAADAREVGSGVLDHPVRATGPGEIAALAADVETMRRVLVRQVDEAAGASRRADRRAPPAHRAGRGAPALEPGPRAVRLRRLARPAGAAAQGRELHPAAAEAVRRAARRARRPVHRVRRRRRQAHAAPHPGPARASPGSAGWPARRSTSTSPARSPTRSANLDEAIAESGAAVTHDALPVVRAERPLRGPAAAEPRRQRGQVPRPGTGRRTSTCPRRRVGDAGRSSAGTTASASTSSTRTGCSSSSSGCTPRTATRAPASGCRCARRSSSTTAARSGSSRCRTVPARASASRCPPSRTPARRRARRPAPRGARPPTARRR